MTFDINNKDNFWLSDTIEPDRDDSAFEENMAERKERLKKLRKQIRNGTYNPSIGEIAISLIKGSMPPNSFR